MYLLIETYETTTSIRQFATEHDAKEYIKNTDAGRKTSVMVAKKHLTLYRSFINDTTFILLDAGIVTLDTLIPGGRLNTAISVDSAYPGLDIEYIPDDPNEYPDETTKPRVVIEKPVETNELAAMLWADISNEDYSHKIRF